MPKNLLLTILAVVALVASACTGSTVETTGEGEVVTDDGSAGAAGSDADGDADADGSDDAGSDDAGSVDGEGSDDGETPQGDGAMLFADAMSGSAVATSGRFEGTFRMTGVDPEAPDTTVEMSMSGAFDQANQATEMTMDLGDLFASGAGAGVTDEIPPGFEGVFDDPMEFIMIGTESWIRWGILSMLTGQEGAWLSLPADDLDSATETFGFGAGATDPTGLLESLADADADVEDLGTESIRGVETTHLRALLDVEKLSAELDPAEKAELEEQLGDLTEAAYPIDLWVGVDDGLLYRYEIDLQGAGFVADDAPANASVFVSFEFFDHGAAVDISPPPADEVVDGASLIGAFG